MSADATANAAAAAAAAEAERRKRQEEEEMTEYSNADLTEEWEFKILRSSMGAFGNPENLRRACEEESRAGWQLVEKFDNERLRFKRPVNARSNDGSLHFDPYRTYYGTSPNTIAVGVIIGTIIVVVTVMCILLLVQS